MSTGEVKVRVVIWVVSVEYVRSHPLYNPNHLHYSDMRTQYVYAHTRQIDWWALAGGPVPYRHKAVNDPQYSQTK